MSCDCTSQFVSDLVGNPEDRFSHGTAHNLENETSIYRLKVPCQSACLKSSSITITMPVLKIIAITAAERHNLMLLLPKSIGNTQEVVAPSQHD